MFFIGSYALNYYIDTGRNPKDIDVIGTYEEVQTYVNSLPGKIKIARPFDAGKKYLFVKDDNTIIEAEIAWEDSLAEEFIQLMGKSKYPSLNGLYTLKMTHRFLKDSPHFLKTMNDIILMRKAGAEITDDLLPFYKKRVKETYQYSHPNLNVKKGEFFSGDGIEYVYDHDTIHECLKHKDRPAYYYFKPNNNDIKVSKDMFNALDERTKLLSVLEEAYVLAIERSQVPYPDKLTPKESFDIALKKICTSITSGWWRDYAWENYYTVMDLYNETYMDKFKIGVETGVVIPYNG